jgi:hypothetical protein
MTIEITNTTNSIKASWKQDDVIIREITIPKSSFVYIDKRHECNYIEALLNNGEKFQGTFEEITKPTASDIEELFDILSGYLE